MDGQDGELRLQSVWDVLIGGELVDVWLVYSNWSKGRLFSHWLLIGSHVSSLHSDHVHGRGSLWLYSQSQPVPPPQSPISSIFALIGRLPPQRIFLISFWCFTTRLLFISPKYAQSLPDMFWSRPKLAHLVPDFAPPQNISNGQVVFPRVVSVRTDPYRSVPSVLPRPKYAHLPIYSQTLF